MTHPDLDTAIPRPDLVNEIEAGLSLLTEPGAVHELRVIFMESGARSGYYNDARELAEAAALYDGRVKGVYFTLNPLKPECLKRGLIKEYVPACNDGDVLERRWLPVDSDLAFPATSPDSLMPNALNSTQLSESKIAISFRSTHPDCGDQTKAWRLFGGDRPVSYQPTTVPELFKS